LHENIHTKEVKNKYKTHKVSNQIYDENHTFTQELNKTKIK